MQHSTAARAALFMQQCRTNLRQPRPSTLSHPHNRTVSSSHLAPSNFSKQTRKRDTEVQHTRFNPPQNQANKTDLLLRKPNTTSPTSQPLPTNAAIPPGFISFLKYRILNLTPPKPAPYKPPPFNVLNNPWRAKKQWPPDFTGMHPKQQFHFEKTFRRRLLLKTNSKRHDWNRYVRLVQQSLVVVTVVYFVFIADPYVKEGGGTPVDGFRAWFFGQVRKFEHLPEGLKEQAGELEGYYGRNWKKAPWGEEEGNGQDVDGQSKDVV